ncbi:XRE family transcriptional regulator, partial [Vibrio splendidus]
AWEHIDILITDTDLGEESKASIESHDVRVILTDPA